MVPLDSEIIVFGCKETTNEKELTLHDVGLHTGLSDAGEKS